MSYLGVLLYLFAIGPSLLLLRIGPGDWSLSQIPMNPHDIFFRFMMVHVCLNLDLRWTFAYGSKLNANKSGRLGDQMCDSVGLKHPY